MITLIKELKAKEKKKQSVTAHNTTVGEYDGTYICGCVFLHACVWHTHAYTHTCTHALTHAHTHTHTQIRTHTNACTWTHTKHTHKHAHIHTQWNTCVCKCVQMCLCIVCVSMSLCVCAKCDFVLSLNLQKVMFLKEQQVWVTLVTLVSWTPAYSA